jgi:superfamily II DNA or RNA helicase
LRAQDFFKRQRPNLKLGWEQVNNGQLRRAQLGAAWALSAHATVSREPALLVLPTGVGKTLVACLAPFLLSPQRVLVVAPGRLVRDQLAAGFSTLADLSRSGILAADPPLPRVLTVEHRAGRTDWTEWRKADVVIGTPNVLSDGFPEVERIPSRMFDLVVFDEAHHLPARVWTAILDAVGAPAVLLTATPTRRDGLPLPGELVYTYPLSQAIEDGVYAPVRFVPVSLPDGADPDATLAAAAADRLATTEHREAESRLLVRAGTQAEARRLVDVYAGVGLKLGLVLGDTAPSTVRRILRDVGAGDMQGFVAVGAMIEGFDFPRLKVAAYHQPHRSLAPTIQFLGRLSRAVPSGVRGELLAIPEQVEGETQELYRAERDWADLMPDIVDAAHEEERRIRRYAARGRISGPLDVSARALAPPRSARIYRLPDDVEPELDIDPERLGRADVVFRFFDPGSQLIAFITHRNVPQRWSQAPVLEVSEFDLHVVTWIEPQRALFVSTESSPALNDLLASLGVDTSVRNLAPEDLVRLVVAADPGSYFSVGLRATQLRRAQGASYDMTAGRAVETALDYRTRASTILGHLMARPKTGNRGTLGFSVAKSKLWEPDNADSLLEFRRWAEQRASELDGPAAGSTLPRLDVQLGQRLDAFPDGLLGATLDFAWLTGQLLARVDNAQVPSGALDLLVRRENELTIEVTLTADDAPVWNGLQSVSGAIVERENLGVQVVETSTGEIVDVPRALQDAPITIFFADGSSVVGDVSTPARAAPASLPESILLADEWQGVTITKELGVGDSVQARTLQIASEGATWVATDHGSGEIADFISLALDGATASVRLYHCKGSGGAAPGRRVGDLYDVIGQCIKSIPWTISQQALWRELRRRLRDREAFSVLHGDRDEFGTEIERLAETPNALVVLEVIAVQPGVSISDLPNWDFARSLLHAAAGWCVAENADFRLLGSR